MAVNYSTDTLSTERILNFRETSLLTHIRLLQLTIRNVKIQMFTLFMIFCLLFCDCWFFIGFVYQLSKLQLSIEGLNNIGLEVFFYFIFFSDIQLFYWYLKYRVSHSKRVTENVQLWFERAVNVELWLTEENANCWFCRTKSIGANFEVRLSCSCGAHVDICDICNF